MFTRKIYMMTVSPFFSLSLWHHNPFAHEISICVSYWFSLWASRKTKPLFMSFRISSYSKFQGEVNLRSTNFIRIDSNNLLFTKEKISSWIMREIFAVELNFSLTKLIYMIPLLYGLVSCVINFPQKYHFSHKGKHSRNGIKLIKLYFHLIISIDIAEKHFSDELTFPNIISVGKVVNGGGLKSHSTHSSLFLIFL